MSELILDAYIPSAGEYDKHWDKFRAFIGAKLSAKAKKQGAYENDTYKNGWYFLRTPLAGSFNGVSYGIPDGTRVWNYTRIIDAGLRVAFQLIYNPECNLVKGCKTMTQTSKVWDDVKGKVYSGNGKEIKVTSEAPIIEFGGKKCIWLNKDECEKGIDKTMKCWTLELIERAVPFDKDGNHNDFGKAKELIVQCESALKEGCSKEELDMLVKVRMRKEDNYVKCEPILDGVTKEKDEREIDRER